MQSFNKQDIFPEHVIISASTRLTESLPRPSEKEAVALTRSTEDLLAPPSEEIWAQPTSPSFFYLCWQKALDLLFGFLCLFVLLLLLPFLALLIYLDSPGPLFYHQERVGYRGRKFLMHKLRSMHPGSSQVDQPLWKTPDDQRVTRIGHFMRATHIDELPQAINILWGEMTLIGPRPQRPEYVAELEKSNPLYRSRANVKPGLTGWAQVNYGYGTSHWDDLTKLQYDLYYIANKSIKLDFLILGKTIIEIMRRRGDK